MKRLLLGAAAVATALVATGCGDDDAPPRAAPATIPAAATLLPDGTVPWVDERATEQEVALPDPNRNRPSPEEAADKPACHAAELSGELDRWTRKRQRDDFGKVLGDNGLLGIVRVRLRASARSACRLRGEVPAQLRVAHAPLDIDTAHGVNAEARDRAIAIEPGEAAALRLDWSSPYCATPRRGRQTLVLDLPEDGGRLRVPVRRASFPRCFGDETQPQRGSVLVSGVFDYPAVATPLDSPLNALRVKVEAGRPVRAGADLTYHVVLVNPTKRAIALRPCPAYREERFSQATAGQDDAINDGQLSRLNCRPVRSIAAGGRRRFEMRVAVPPSLASGRRLTITWGLRARGLAPGPALEGGFRARIP
jgi:hypothetical protein